MTRAFARFERKERLGAIALRGAVSQAESGLVGAELGGGLVKLRVARAGQGKRGGYRTIIAYRRGQRAVFLYGFAKSERDNIDMADLEALKAYGKLYLGFSGAELGIALGTGVLHEVREDD
jgi:hypothetical protein